MSDEAKPQLAPGLAGTLLSGRYRLESKLGSGGMSTVYLARDETLERWVAVKVLHREISDQPDQLERFRREARAVAQLSHPNVVAVIDAGEDGGHPYIVFEYVSGETLKQRIDRMDRLPLDEVAAYGIETGRGLAAAHARRLIHRDVKPQNVLIDAEGRAKVTDFGIALSQESDGLTKTGRVLGTTDYVSPEQAMGREVDARSDIYSLGVLLYEMLIGQPPFRAETLVAVAMKHVNDPMPAVQERRPEVSAALSAVIERSTRKEPSRRYPDMGAMLADLEGALEVEVARSGSAGGEATSVLASVPDRRRLLPGRRASLAGIGVVLLATAIALLIAALTGGGGSGGGSGGGPAVSSGNPIEIRSAQDFDPLGTAGEHPDEVDLAIDGSDSTGWTTESYQTSPILADDGKAGVGLILDAGKPVAARTMSIRSAEGGWDAKIYGAPNGPPTSAPPAGWTELGSVSGASSDESVELDTANPLPRYLLIWITKLSPRVGEGGYSLELDDVTVTD